MGWDVSPVVRGAVAGERQRFEKAVLPWNPLSLDGTLSGDQIDPLTFGQPREAVQT